MTMPTMGEAMIAWFAFSALTLIAFWSPDGPSSRDDLKTDERVAATVLLAMAGPIPLAVFISAITWWVAGAMCTGTLSLVLRIFPGLRKFRSLLSRKPKLPVARISRVITKP